MQKIFHQKYSKSFGNFIYSKRIFYGFFSSEMFWRFFSSHGLHQKYLFNIKKGGVDDNEEGEVKVHRLRVYTLDILTWFLHLRQGIVTFSSFFLFSIISWPFSSNLLYISFLSTLSHIIHQAIFGFSPHPMTPWQLSEPKYKLIINLSSVK